MEDGTTPSLEVGFVIDTGGSFSELQQLQQVMNSTEAKIVSEAANIERATGGMLNVSGAAANMRSFGNAASREMQNVTRETARAEKAGEAMVRQLQRQTETYGKTRSEIRDMRAELRAVSAEEQGLTELAARIRSLNAEMQRLETVTPAIGHGLGGVGTTGKLASHHMQNLAFQFQDLGLQMYQAAGSSAPLKLAFTALLQQGSQINGIMGQAGIGIRGVGAAFLSMSKSVLIATATNPYLLALGATIGLFAGAVSMLNREANKGDAVKKYAEGLGLTAKEIRNLDNVTVTWGDTAKAVFQVAGKAIWGSIGPAVTSVWSTMKEWAAWVGSGVKAAANFLIGGMVGAYNTIKATWRQLPAAMGDAFYTAVNASIGAINFLIRKTVDGLNAFLSTANSVLGNFGLHIAPLSAGQLSTVKNQYAGQMKDVGKTAWAAFDKSFATDYVGNVGGAIVDQALQNAKDRIRAQAEDKGYLDPKKARATKDRLSDEAKAYQEATKAAQDYIDAQAQETARIGKTAKEIRALADAAAIAKAPTEALRQAIRDAATAREAAYAADSAKQFDANVLQPIRDEIALYGLVGPQRDAAALQLEKQAFIAKNMGDGIAVATERWKQYYALKMQILDKDVAAQREADAIKALNDELAFTADKFDLIARNVETSARGMADAFGSVGQAIGDMASIYSGFQADRARMDAQHIASLNAIAASTASATKKQLQVDRENAKFQLASANSQIGLYGDMASAAKGFFDEKSKGYAAVQAAEKVFRAFEFAMSVKSMVQDAAETISSVANSGARATAAGAEGVANQSKLPFPVNIVAMAATAAALVAAGIAVLGSGGGASAPAPVTNTGTGTVFGDATAQSDSIKNAINALKEVDTLTNTYARQMASSLKSIENQIGGLANLVVRAGGDMGVPNITEGFKANWIGSLLGNIPLIGGILSSLFGSTTTVMGSGIYGGAQSLGSVLNGGFNAKYYSDLQKKSKFLGIVTGTKNYTEYSNADPGLTSQFTLLLKSFNDAIVAAAGPLGAATDQIQNRLNSFVINLGKIDLKGLTGQEIQDKLTAVFGAAADKMAQAAYPIITQFQKVGEGAFETLVRVASTLEQVSSTLDLLGQSAQGMGMAAKLGLADQFDSVSDLTSAAETYFQDFYTKEEQAAAKTAQLAKVFDSLGFTMPSTLAAFRQLVEAQDLTTAAGQATYATLLKLAPAFADLQSSLEGAKSAADIASERNDLQRQLLQLQGNTAALRALDLAKLDVSNRALQEQIWAIQDAQTAAKAAQDLADSWKSVGNSIMDEVKRIRGLTTTGNGSFASLLGQFNAATTSARSGDIDAAKSLPALSQALLNAAKDAATSRQEIDRIQAQTAASLEATYGVIGALSAAATSTATDAQVSAAGASQAVNQPSNDNPSTALPGMVASLSEEIGQLRTDMNARLTAVVSNTGAIKQKFDDVTSQSGGDAISTVNAA